MAACAQPCHGIEARLKQLIPDETVKQFISYDEEGVDRLKRECAKALVEFADFEQGRPLFEIEAPPWSQHQGTVLDKELAYVIGWTIRVSGNWLSGMMRLDWPNPDLRMCHFT